MNPSQLRAGTGLTSLGSQGPEHILLPSVHKDRLSSCPTSCDCQTTASRESREHRIPRSQGTRRAHCKKGQGPSRTRSLRPARDGRGTLLLPDGGCALGFRTPSVHTLPLTHPTLYAHNPHPTVHTHTVQTPLSTPHHTQRHCLTPPSTPYRIHTHGPQTPLWAVGRTCQGNIRRIRCVWDAPSEKGGGSRRGKKKWKK